LAPLFPPEKAPRKKKNYKIIGNLKPLFPVLFLKFPNKPGKIEIPPWENFPVKFPPRIPPVVLKQKPQFACEKKETNGPRPPFRFGQNP